MSLVSAHAASLKPELRLVKAISEFEMMLSVEQKADLQKHTQIPDTDDVMRLTAEIDRASTARVNERRRCYGPRVTNFLEGVHQFASTVDIAVGGAIQSRTASGVWAVVRFSLLALTKYSPYIEKLSKTFMEIGRDTPSFKEMSKLYPGSQRIQDALSEYYIIIVELCKEIYTISQASTIGQLWTAFADESYKQRLEHWSHAIQTEMSLETAKLAKLESKQNQAFRFTSRKHMELQRRQQQQEFKQRVLDACSKHKFPTIWKQTRKLGNTTLFLNDAAYQEWLSIRSSCTLLYSGRLGSGKSVLLANIINDLYIRNDTGIMIAYFFCRYDVTESLEATTIIGCLARQLLQHSTDPEPLVQKSGIDISSTIFDIEDLLELVKSIATKPVRFVIDGFDDLNQSQKQMLLDSIYDLQKTITVMVCLSTRSPHDVCRGTRLMERILYATTPQENPDIERYIDEEIDNRLASGLLLISDESLVQEVKMKLSTKAQGMFLWVYLQILNLSTMASDFEIRKALDDLPSSLAATYNRLLQGSDSAESPYRSRLFELLLVAYRPLHYNELCEALSFEPGEIEFNPSKLLNSIDGVLQSCNGLVSVDEEEMTVRLVHFSADQFLTSAQYENRLDRSTAQQRIFETIVKYLNSSILETQLTRHKPNNLNIAAVPAALLMMKMPRIAKHAYSKRKDQVSINTSNTTVANVPCFKAYALEYWGSHLMANIQTDSCLDLLDAAIAKGRISLVIKQNRLSLLERAVIAQNNAILTRLIKRGACEDDWHAATRCAEALHYADAMDILVQGHEDHPYLLKLSIHVRRVVLVESLLRVCSQEFWNETHKELNGLTPLSYAIRTSDEALVAMFLGSAKIDPKQRSCYHECPPLYDAVEMGNFKIVEMLMIHTPLRQIANNRTLWAFIFQDHHMRTGHRRYVDYRPGEESIPYRAYHDLSTVQLPAVTNPGMANIVCLLLSKGYIHKHDHVDMLYRNGSPVFKTTTTLSPFLRALFLNRVDIVDGILQFNRSNNGRYDGRVIVKRSGTNYGTVAKFIDYAPGEEMRALLMSYSSDQF